MRITFLEKEVGYFLFVVFQIQCYTTEQPDFIALIHAVEHPTH